MNLINFALLINFKATKFITTLNLIIRFVI